MSSLTFLSPKTSARSLKVTKSWQKIKKAISDRYSNNEEDWNLQELIRRWDSERELFHDDIVHVEAIACAHWIDFLISTVAVCANLYLSSEVLFWNQALVSSEYRI